ADRRPAKPGPPRGLGARGGLLFLSAAARPCDVPSDGGGPATAALPRESRFRHSTTWSFPMRQPFRINRPTRRAALVLLALLVLLAFTSPAWGGAMRRRPSAFRS